MYIVQLQGRYCFVQRHQKSENLKPHDLGLVCMLEMLSYLKKGLNTNQQSPNELDGDGDAGDEKKPRDENHLQCANLQKTERRKNVKIFKMKAKDELGRPVCPLGGKVVGHQGPDDQDNSCRDDDSNQNGPGQPKSLDFV